MFLHNVATVINSILYKVTPTRRYCYFDQFNQLQTKRFHIFQRMIRCFGGYKNTHLSNVIKRGYLLSLEGVIQERRMLKVISKVQKKYGVNSDKSYFQLPDYNLANGSTVKIGVRYKITFDPSGHASISSIDFTFKSNTTEIMPGKARPFPKVEFVTLVKNLSGNLVAVLPPATFQPNQHDTAQTISDRITHQRARIINDLLAKTLNDSNYVHLGLPSYEMLCYLDRPLAQQLSNAQDSAMGQLGWRFHKEYQEPSQGPIIYGMQHVYRYTSEDAKANQNLVNAGFNQKLSLITVAPKLGITSIGNTAKITVAGERI